MAARRRMGRREALGALGAVGAALVLPSRAATSGGAAALDCVVVPEMTEGPFFVDEGLERSDLVAGTSEPFVTKGLPLVLQIGVFEVAGRACAPLAGSQVDIWHASAEGVYSDQRSGRIQDKDTVGEKYLRGYQRTDRNGAVTFATIYPGWYASRTVHVHCKIRSFEVGTAELRIHLAALLRRRDQRRRPRQAAVRHARLAQGA